MHYLLVSACLLGETCRYDGKEKRYEAIDALRSLPDLTLVPFCPECAGGLAVPRVPCERKDGRVIARDGTDKTGPYTRGAGLALETAKERHILCALLKERSPSCGVHEIYDGTFTRTVIPGSGVTAELLKQNGIRVYSETEIEALYEYIQNLSAL